MSSTKRTAYITGGASGIGRAIADMLAKRKVDLVLADVNLSGAQQVAAQLSDTHNVKCQAVQVDVADWTQQVSAFKEVASKTRIDYVFPIAGIGEKPWTDNDPTSKEGEYKEPNLVVLDIDLKGVLYTTSLAIQHFRRQSSDDSRIKGRIVTVASVCGLYCVPTLPIYTAAKHAIVGFTRSYGAHLPEEGITFNAICPNIVQTSISSPEFYAKVDDAGVLVPIENVVAAVERFLEDGEEGKRSGICVEVGPRGTRDTTVLEPMDEASKLSCELLHERARPLHVAKKG